MGKIERLTFELSVLMADGTELAVVADQRDMAKFEVQTFGWPIGQMEQRAGVTFFRYLAYSALQRHQMLDTGLTWDEFNDRKCVSVDALDDGEGEEGDPTPPSPGAPAGTTTPSATPTSPPRGRRVSHSPSS